MSKKHKNTKNNSPFSLKNIIVSVVCLVIGLIVGFVGNIIFSLPDSYKIPQSVTGSAASAVGIDKDEINSHDLSIHFLELGNKYTGDCILIRVGDVQILVDGGSKASSIPYITSYVEDFLEDGDDKCLDYIIVTHAHEDHYAGFATNSSTQSLFDYFRSEEKGYSIGTIITYAKTNKEGNKVNAMQANFNRELAEAMASGAECYSALECYKMQNGAKQSYSLGNDTYLNILYQKYYEEYSSSENNYSVCFEIKQSGKKYLFTGDLEKEGEASLVAENTIGKVELYKAGHHGSKTSSSADLLEKIKPNIVVVCCVAGSSEYTSKNENQFPTQEFVNNVSVYTSQIYVTSLCIDYSSNQFTSFNGTIVICSNTGGETKVYCSNNNTVLKNTDWFKANRTLPENAVA